VLERIRAQPGVRAASLAVLTPLSGRDTGRQIRVSGFEARTPQDRAVRVNHVSDDYFRTFGIGLRAGRAFTSQDRRGSLNVAVINDAAARFYFGNRDPIGETIAIGPSATYQIVGVAGDYKHRNLREATPRFLFVPVAQPLDGLSRITLAVASDRPSPELATAIANEVRAIAPSTLVSEVLDVQEQIDATLVSEQMLSTLSSGFGLLALGLAAIGLYGVLSHSVAQRRTEFAVRLALGAPPARVASGVFREVLIPLAIGIATGLPAAFAVTRFGEALLFGVTPGDPANYFVSVLLLSSIACLAAWLPARRAWSINPVDVLRSE
jgi:predicted permease